MIVIDCDIHENGNLFPGNGSGTSDAASFGKPCEAARAAASRPAVGAKVTQPAAADSMRRHMVDGLVFLAT